jgi:ethanolamine utilization protein EutA (predicted chaperonin)
MRCTRDTIIGKLAAAIVVQLKQRIAVPIVEPAERIHATVIGASQFTVQVSGKMIFLPRRGDASGSHRTNPAR